VAAAAWAKLLTEAAPLLRASTGCPGVILSRDGETLTTGNAIGHIATAALTAAGLPGLTARSVRQATVVAFRDAALPTATEEALSSIMGNSTRRGAWRSML
jgi:hypothetical protein